MGLVNVRISGDAETALGELTSDGTSVSDAVRGALVAAVALRRREKLRADAAHAIADQDDREALEQVIQEWADVGTG